MDGAIFAAMKLCSASAYAAGAWHDAKPLEEDVEPEPQLLFSEVRLHFLLSIYMYTYIYIHIQMYICKHIYMYTHALPQHVHEPQPLAILTQLGPES